MGATRYTEWGGRVTRDQAAPQPQDTLEQQIAKHREAIDELTRLAHEDPRFAQRAYANAAEHPLAGIVAPNAWGEYAPWMIDTLRQNLYAKGDRNLVEILFTFLVEPFHDTLEQQIRHISPLQADAGLLARAVETALTPLHGTRQVSAKVPSEKSVASIIEKARGRNGDDGRLQEGALKLVNFLNETAVDDLPLTNWDMLQALFYSQTEQYEGCGRFLRPVRFYNLLPDGGRITLAVESPMDIERAVMLLGDPRELPQRLNNVLKEGLNLAFGIGSMDDDVFIQVSLEAQRRMEQNADIYRWDKNKRMGMLRYVERIVMGDAESFQKMLPGLVAEGFLNREDVIALAQYAQSLPRELAESLELHAVDTGMQAEQNALRAHRFANDELLRELTVPDSQHRGFQPWIPALFTPPNGARGPVYNNVFGFGGEVKPSGLTFDQRRVAIRTHDYVAEEDAGTDAGPIFKWSIFECQFMSHAMYEAKQQGDLIYQLARKLKTDDSREGALKSALQQLEVGLYARAMALDGEASGAFSRQWRAYYDEILSEWNMAMDWQTGTLTRHGAVVAQADMAQLTGRAKGRSGNEMALCLGMLHSVAEAYDIAVPAALQRQPHTLFRHLRDQLPRSLHQGVPSFVDTLARTIAQVCGSPQTQR